MYFEMVLEREHARRQTSNVSEEVQIKKSCHMNQRQNDTPFLGVGVGCRQ